MMLNCSSELILRTRDQELLSQLQEVKEIHAFGGVWLLRNVDVNHSLVIPYRLSWELLVGPVQSRTALWVWT